MFLWSPQAQNTIVHYNLTNDPTLAIDIPNNNEVFLSADVNGFVYIMRLESPTPIKSINVFNMYIKINNYVSCDSQKYRILFSLATYMDTWEQCISKTILNSMIFHFLSLGKSFPPQVSIKKKKKSFDWFKNLVRRYVCWNRWYALHKAGSAESAGGRGRNWTRIYRIGSWIATYATFFTWSCIKDDWNIWGTIYQRKQVIRKKFKIDYFKLQSQHML